MADAPGTDAVQAPAAANTNGNVVPEPPAWLSYVNKMIFMFILYNFFFRGGTVHALSLRAGCARARRFG